MGLISTRVHPHIADRIILFKQISVGIPQWDIIKKQIVDYSEDCAKREKQIRRFNPSINNTTRNQEAHDVTESEQVCFNCNKKRHLRPHCPLSKTTHYGPRMRPPFGMLLCVGFIKIHLLKPLNMTTEVCVSNGLCFPPRRVA